MPHPFGFLVFKQSVYLAKRQTDRAARVDTFGFAGYFPYHSF
jgi:hypothetical protein